jgi:hypothetical protein
MACQFIPSEEYSAVNRLPVRVNFSQRGKPVPSMTPRQVVVVCVPAVAELKAENAALQQKMAALEAKLEALAQKLP